jgi:hypothetical protein
MQEPLILEGILVHPLERRTGVVVPPAPPPTEALEIEPFSPHLAPTKRRSRSIAQSSRRTPRAKE